MEKAERSKYAVTLDLRMLLVAVLTFSTYAMYHVVRIGFAGIKSSLKHYAGFTTTALGGMDTFYLFAYSGGQFVCGRFSDLLRPKRMLIVGMLLCSLLPVLEGIMGFYEVGGASWLGYWAWVAIRSVEGLFQATGWSATVGIMGNWFPISGRGTVFGLWATCASWGDIFGLHWSAFILKGFGEERWYMVLYTVGLLMFCMACTNLFLLMGEPLPKSLDWQHDEVEKGPAEPFVQDQDGTEEEAAGREATIMEVLQIPGLLPYATSYIFLKLVNYALFLWLPFYLSEAAGMEKSVAHSMASLFDWGFILGGFIAGLASDMTSHRAGMPMRSPVVSAFLVAALAPLAVLRGSTDPKVMAIAIFFCGVFQGGPAEALTSSVSVDLGTHPCLKGARATSTVTGFIDGTGALGAAMGQYLVSYISEHFGWASVFTFLLCSLGCTFALSLLRLREELEAARRSVKAGQASKEAPNSDTSAEEESSEVPE